MRVKAPLPALDLPSVTSTQDVAKAELSSGRTMPFWVLAREQTQGRGRAKREWQSDAGNYSATLVWPMPKSAADAPKFSILTAHALCQSFEALGLTDIEVKWPNDVLWQRRKMAGILLEAEGAALLIGTGVNLRFKPQKSQLQTRALETAALSERVEISFEDFHHLYEEALLQNLNDFEAFGFEPAREAIRNRLLVREDMIYDDGQASTLVRPLDLGREGQLIVDMDGTQKELYAGDLWMKEGA